MYKRQEYDEARRLLTENGGVDPLIDLSRGPQSWLRSQAAGILQRLDVQAPPPKTLAETMALKLGNIKPYYMTIDHDKQKSARSRGWDSAHGNPRFESETGEFDHLLFSPRMIKNSYRAEVKKISPHRERPTPPPPEPAAPLDFDMPNYQVAAALARSKGDEPPEPPPKVNFDEIPAAEAETSSQGSNTPKGSKKKGRKSKRGPKK